MSRETGKKVAIKLVRDYARSSYSCLQVLREIKILKELNKMQAMKAHHVPQLMDVIICKPLQGETERHLFLVMSSMKMDLR